MPNRSQLVSILQLLIALVLVFATARVAGWFFSRKAVVDVQRPILAELDQQESHYYYDYQLVDATEGTLADREDPRIRKHWLSELLGDAYFHEVFYITFAKFSSHRKDGSVATQQNNIDNRYLTRLLNFQGLRWLALIGTAVTDEGMDTVASMPKIERLWLSQTKVTDDGLRRLTRAKSLTHLSIEATATSDRGLAAISQLPKLRSLSIGSPYFSPSGLQQLANMQSLEHLFLDRLPVDDSVLQKVSTLLRLKELSIRQTLVSNAGLEKLSTLKNLKKLHIDGCLLTDEGLKVATSWPELETLSWTNSQLSDAALVHLRNCPKLKSLRLSNSRCTLTGVLDLFRSRLGKSLPEALKAVFEIKQDAEGKILSANLNAVRMNDRDLEILSEMPSIQWLEMQASDITDAGAKRLAELGLSRLQLIKLDDSKISDAGFESLCQLKSLRDLHLRRTAVTESAVARIRQSNPQLRVYLADETTKNNRQ